MRGDAGKAALAQAAHGSAAMNALASNRAWEVDRELLLARSERRAWFVATAAIAVGVLAIAVDLVRGALRQTVPIAIVVDKSTGETTVQLPLSSASVPLEDAVDKHFAVQFVTAREEYDWSWLNRDYNTVARMADPEVFAPYAGMFSGQKGASITDRLGDRVQWRVAIVGVRFPPMAPAVPSSASPNSSSRVREAFVTFDRQAYDVHEKANVGLPQRFVASLRFEYRPKLALSDAERIDNPLGFVVTAYRTDAEFGTAAGSK
ncbi:Type IV secretory pathway, component VirB8 [Burkholderiales bacterium]|nr:Type IV secretory pathway, component VirB8 [Burkholderiales bacterium]